MKRRGFTLIELLVVVAIISLLAAILFPVFARARENARRTGCLSNLKQLGLGMNMYVQDYDERFPRAYYYLADGTTQFTWRHKLEPYVKNVQVFICPSSTSTSSLQGNYGVNARFIPIQGDGTTYTLADLTGTSGLYMLLDSGFFKINPQYAYDSKNWEYLPGEGSAGGKCNDPARGYKDCMTGRHFDGVNVTFADGHAKWLKSSVVIREARDYYIANEPSGWHPQRPQM